jgi:uncharacterized delta-60 repeat protein
MALISLALAGGAAAVRGQSADGFDPNANGTVRVVVVQPDGKILIGGDFTTLSPNGGGAVARNHIARLNPDGTLDTVFDPNANSFVFSIAVQADGKIFIGGQFTALSPNGGGMVTRNGIARVNPDGTLDTAFDPNANSSVDSIAVQADGKILAGGGFTSIGGQNRNRIARLDATTGLADSFNPNANGFVGSITVQADGKILVAGAFNGANSIGGQTRNFIARLDATTGLADSFNPNANDNVDSIAVQADGKILAAGAFNGPNSIGGQTRNRIARLDATTGLADSLNPNANDEVVSIAVQADGKILAGGFFNGIGGQTRNRIARLDATTGLAESFNPNANSIVLSIAVQADGKILAGGFFTSIGGQTRNHIARLQPGPQLTGAVSRKMHGAAGTFDVPLPLTGNVGIECRSGGATNDYQMIFNFMNPVTVGSAAVTSGTGSVSSFSVSGSQVTVNLTGVTNAQRITVTLFNVNDGMNSGDVPVSMGVLVGDVNGNAVVNASDVSLTKSQVGQAVSGSNFREDVNANGLINSMDVALVKSKVGTALP